MSKLNLVFLSKDNTPLTSSTIIAGALQYEHKSVIQLIRARKADLEQFGALRVEKLETIKNQNKNDINQNYTFEMRKCNIGRKPEVAYLNEHQATLLICFMKNTEKVRQFKVALVKAFFEMRNQLQSTLGKKWTEAEVTQECKEIQSLAYSLGYAKGVESVKAHYKEKEKEWEAEKEEEGQESYGIGYDKGYDEGGHYGFKVGYEQGYKDRDNMSSLSREEFNRLVNVYSNMNKSFYDCAVYVNELTTALSTLDNVKRALVSMSREPALERLFILDKLQSIQKMREQQMRELQKQEATA